MKELNIDCMKYRKSTHLAGVDVDIITKEKGSCILTIKECYYNTGVDVSGNKTDGYFIVFKEGVKDMVVNSSNRTRISNIAKSVKSLDDSNSRNIGNWVDLQIELYFDSSVKMMGKTTGGIKVKEEAPKPMTAKEINVIKARIAACVDLNELSVLYNSDVKIKTNEVLVGLVRDKNKTLQKK